MKIAVIGTIVRDEIHHFDGTVSRSLGGLLHTVQALRALSGTDDEIHVFSYAGMDIRPQLEILLKGAANVRTEGIRFLERQNNYVRIEYFSPGQRTEYSLSPLPALPFDILQDALRCDVILINMISGWDVQLAALQKMRKRFSGLLAMDVHSLLLKRKKNGQRYFKPPPEIKEWLKAPDILQMNEKEFSALSGGKTVENFFLRDSCFEDGKILNLTFGAQGSGSWQKGVQGAKPVFAGPPAGVEVLDPTGCGDAFMAGFCYEYVRMSDIRWAAQTANLVAAISGSFHGLAEPRQLREKLKEFYG